MRGRANMRVVFHPDTKHLPADVLAAAEKRVHKHQRRPDYGEFSVKKQRFGFEIIIDNRTPVAILFLPSTRFLDMNALLD